MSQPIETLVTSTERLSLHGFRPKSPWKGKCFCEALGNTWKCVCFCGLSICREATVGGPTVVTEQWMLELLCFGVVKTTYQTNYCFCRVLTEIIMLQTTRPCNDEINTIFMERDGLNMMQPIEVPSSNALGCTEGLLSSADSDGSDSFKWWPPVLTPIWLGDSGKLVWAPHISTWSTYQNEKERRGCNCWEPVLTLFCFSLWNSVFTILLLFYW